MAFKPNSQDKGHGNEVENSGTKQTDFGVNDPRSTSATQACSDVMNT